MTSERTCMLVTSGDDGRLKAHPMTTQEADDHGDAWFIASSRSETVADIRARPQVNVSYAGSSSWLSIAGRATVVQDAAKKEELWNTFTEAWFPDGKDDPSIVVIKVSGDSAQHWDSPGRVLTIASMLKARVTGHTPDSRESATVDLSDA